MRAVYCQKAKVKSVIPPPQLTHQLLTNHYHQKAHKNSPHQLLKRILRKELLGRGEEESVLYSYTLIIHSSYLTKLDVDFINVLSSQLLTENPLYSEFKSMKKNCI